MSERKTPQDDRKARLAEQLRANLRKRKAQARAVAGDAAGSSVEPAPTSSE
jgi:hypothetical protein